VLINQTSADPRRGLHPFKTRTGKSHASPHSLDQFSHPLAFARNNHEVSRLYFWSYVRTDAFFHSAASGSGAQRRTAQNKVTGFLSEHGSVLKWSGSCLRRRGWAARRSV